MTPFAEVIGDPIAHSKSPLIHNFWLRKLGIDAEYRATCVVQGALGDYFASRAADPAWRGCNITMPHKIAAAAFIDQHGAPDRPINTAIQRDGRLEGVNTDVAGVREPLEALLRQAPNDLSRRKSAAVVGAGGALYPVLTALPLLGYSKLTVIARDPDRLAEVRRRHDNLDIATLPLGEPLPAVDLLVNASPLGMTGFPAFPYQVEAIDDHAILFEMVYSPVETELLKSARTRGLRTVDGLQMLVAQAAAAFEHFFGRPAPRVHDAELRALLLA